ncbi:MAG: hypothetical protein ACRCX2_14695 [Paraclostridium sp.]
MKLNENIIQHYSHDIMLNVMRYAYENAEVGRLLNEEEVEWFGEVFNVSDIEEILHKDIIFYLKKENLYRRIKEESDSLIILPNVFSELPFPKSANKRKEVDENSIMGYGVPNILLINNSVFELVDEKVKGIKFNYAGKMYYFFNSNKPEATRLISNKPLLKVIATIKYTEFNFDEKYPIGTEVNGSFLFNIDIDNKVLEVNDTEDYLTLKIDFPYIKVNYDSGSVVTESTIKGLYSLQPLDVGIQEKIHDQRENQFIIHRRDITFCDTMIIIYKDNTYRITNASFDTAIAKIDKHTVTILKNDNVKDIVLFFKPVLIDLDIARVDYLYDEIMKISEYGFFDLSHKKNTTFLYNWILRQRPSVEDIISYGYEHDLDVLHAIQMAFPTQFKITPENFYLSKSDPHGKINSRTRQLFVEVSNPLKLNPILFFNGRVYDSDSNKYINGDNIVVHLNMKEFNPMLNNLIKDESKTIENIREFLKGYRIEVALLTDIIDDNFGFKYHKEFKPTLPNSNSTIVSKNELIGNDYSTYLVNGFGSTIEDTAFTLFYNVPVYGIGESNDLKIQLLFSKMKEFNSKFMKLNHIVPANEFRYSEDNLGVFNLENYFGRNSAIWFNHEGLMDHNDVKIITDDYIAITSNLNSIHSISKGIRFIKLPRKNLIYDIDLEIDYALVGPLNVGSYNENCVNTNPNILTYFCISDVFNSKPLCYDQWNHNDIKNSADIIASFGSIGSNPYHLYDYRKYLKENNITIIDHNTLIPNEDSLSKEFKHLFKFFHIAKAVYTNIYSLEQLKDSKSRTYLDTSRDSKLENPQMDFHLKSGLLTGYEHRLIPIDSDIQFNFSEDFLSPPYNDVMDFLVNRKINMNYAFDKQMLMTIQPKYLDINTGTGVAPLTENILNNGEVLSNNFIDSKAELALPTIDIDVDISLKNITSDMILSITSKK